MIDCIYATTIKMLYAHSLMAETISSRFIRHELFSGIGMSTVDHMMLTKANTPDGTIIRSILDRKDVMINGTLHESLPEVRQIEQGQRENVKSQHSIK